MEDIVLMYQNNIDQTPIDVAQDSFRNNSKLLKKEGPKSASKESPCKIGGSKTVRDPTPAPGKQRINLKKETLNCPAPSEDQKQSTSSIAAPDSS